MYLFLQNWRATIIPTIVVPIALLGSCIGLWMLGFSINVLTLFGMVLAIGILVDDAIVVIENVERVMEEDKSTPYEATIKAVRQIYSAIIRSEEHTSELQTLMRTSYAVFCLKKKQTNARKT